MKGISYKNIKTFFAYFVSSTALAASLILFFGLTALAQTKAVIRISAENTIETDQVTLGSIARISANPQNAGRLAGISLGFAPNVGMLREINRERILLSISAAGFTENEFTLLAPPKISIRRSMQTLDQNLIRETVEKAVLSNFQTNSVSVKITKLDFPEKIELPKGNLDIKATGLTTVSNFLTPFIVSLEIRVETKVVRRISANVAVELFADVLVANKNLTVNEKINESSVRLEKVRLERSLANYVCDTDKLHGKKLLKNLAADAPLTADAIADEAVIRAGDVVKIIGQAGKLQITVTGEARTSGRIGDRITVKNSQSGAVLQAIVVDEGIVKINF